MENNERDYREIDDILKRLKFLTRQLSMGSHFLVIILFASIVSLAVFSFYLKQRFYYSNYFISYVLSIMLPSVGILTLFLVSRQRKKGMVYYEELVDELEWSAKRKELRERIPIEYRITIKEFIKSTDLPFTSGPSGQSFYFVIFLVLIIMTIVLGSILT